MNEISAVEDRASVAFTPASEVVKFTMRGAQLLSSGKTMTPLGSADNMWIHGKVYADGGENELHAHLDEDHTFIVLQGRAEFEFEGGASQFVEAFDGLLVPKGVLYRFQAAGTENLVMIRVGSAQRGADWSGEKVVGLPVEMRQAVGKELSVTDNATAAKGKLQKAGAVPVPGKFFPEG